MKALEKMTDQRLFTEMEKVEITIRNEAKRPAGIREKRVETLSDKWATLQKEIKSRRKWNVFCSKVDRSWHHTPKSLLKQ